MLRIRIPITAAVLLVAAFWLAMTTSARAQDAPDQDTAQSDLVINEIMASNSSTLQDPDEPGEYPDWLELYNPTNAPVSLDGLYLIRGDVPDLTTFAITVGLSIPAKGFLVFFADDDPKQGPLHTNFRLSKDADKVGLYADPDGIVEIDSHSFVNQVTDYSEGRDPDGGPNWRLFNRPTPGRSNDARPPVVADVRFSPALPTSAQSIDVTATISDEGSIASAQIVYTVDDGAQQTAAMAPNGGNRYQGAIPPQADGAIVTFFVMATDNDGEVTPDPNVGAPPLLRFPIGYTIPTVIINEFMADNLTTLEDPDDPGDFADWIELYNPGSTPVPLGGLYLSDNPDDPTKFAITDTLTLGVGQYLLFFADEDQEQGPLHTNFKLNKDGETVALYGAQGTVELDRVDWGELPSAASYGRIPNGADWPGTVIFCPTPGAPNTDCAGRSLLPLVIMP
ncbi:MAG: lamin tail domain-containing protein [Caldilineaceae bacterium]|nr:lamin tail domain-containing protein [Caldilineaceae bacterium]